MPRYIDADALLLSADHLPYSYNGAAWLQAINNTPTVDVAPVVRGKWEINGYCSECRGRAPFWSMASTYYKSNYCPNCGADMRGSEVKE